MPIGIYVPLGIEPDIEWADLLEKLVVRNLMIAEAYADLAEEYSVSNPVLARDCIEIAKRRLIHHERLLQSGPV